MARRRRDPDESRDPDEKGRKLQELRDQGMTVGQAGKELGMSRNAAEKAGQRYRRRLRRRGDNQE